MSKKATGIEREFALAHEDLRYGIDSYVEASCKKGRAEPSRVKALAKLAGIMVISFCVASVSSIPLALTIAIGGALIARNDMAKDRAAAERIRNL